MDGLKIKEEMKMDRVYSNDLNGEYTTEAVELEGKARKLLRGIIREEIKKGTPSEAIEYILIHGMHMELFAQKFSIKKEKEQKTRQDEEHDEKGR